MYFNKRYKLLSIFLFLILIFNIFRFTTFADDNVSSSTNSNTSNDITSDDTSNKLPDDFFVQDNNGILTQSDNDQITNIAQQLDKGNVRFILIVEKRSLSNDPVKDLKTKYFTWLGKLPTGKQLIVMDYDMSKSKLYYYQDANNFVSSSFISKTEGILQSYQNHNDLSSGLKCSYNLIANQIANKEKLNLTGLDMQVKYKFNTIKGIPEVFGILIILVLIFSFRRKK